MKDSYTLGDHPRGRSTTFYNTILGSQNGRQLFTVRPPRGRSTAFYITALGGQNERQVHTQGVGQPLSTTPLWEASMNDSYTL